MLFIASATNNTVCIMHLNHWLATASTTTATHFFIST